MQTRTVIEQVFSFLANAGYRVVPPASIVSPSFSDTFNPSGAHDLVRSFLLLDRPLPTIERVAGVDPCFRHIDIERSGMIMVIYKQKCQQVDNLTHPSEPETVIVFCIGVGKLSDRVSCLRLGWLRGIAGMGVVPGRRCN